MARSAQTGAEPARNCDHCPRLVAYRRDNSEQYPDFFNGAVPSFGDENARLTIVGLAPGLQGANRTGRPFTGDYAGDLLYPSLISHGFARGAYDRRPDDGLALIDTLITNAVRCVPPANKPSAAEINTCRPFLKERLSLRPQGAVILTLGRIAHESSLKALGGRSRDHLFRHGAVHWLGETPMVNSYHCSRYNVNTGRLTPAMFDAVLATCRRLVDGEPV